MKYLLISNLFFLCALGLNAQKVTIDLNESFEAVKIYDRLNVEMVKSSKNQLVITGDDTDEVTATVKDGTLKVRMDLGNFMDGNETIVVLYYNGELDLIDVNEGAEISSGETISSNYLTLKAQEGGRLNLPITCKNVQVKAITGGKIFVSGTAVNADISIRSGGEYGAKDLKTIDCDITVLAGGSAKITSSGRVDASVTAGGTIEVYGTPEKIEQDKTLGGSIIVK